jgi:L-lactate permease
MFAGVTGALGAFISGSNTVSNLNFLEKPLSARKLLAALNKYFENITALHSEGR